MKFAVLVLVVCFSFSQAFNPWGVFQKWKGEVEEALNSSKKNEHAERFLKEVKDKGVELLKKHEELGNDLWQNRHQIRNKVHKVWEKVTKGEPKFLPKTYEPEIEPTEPEIIPTEYEVIPNESEAIEEEHDIMPIQAEVISKEPEFIAKEPAEIIEEPDIVEEPEPVYGYKEPEPFEPSEIPQEQESSEEKHNKEPSTSEAPEVLPTEIPEKIEPTEIPERIEESVEDNNEEDDDEDEKDNESYEIIEDHDDDDSDDGSDDDNQSNEEDVSPVKVQPISEEVAIIKPKESWEGLQEAAALGHKWLKKRQHKLKKLWKKFNSKHTESLVKKIRKLEHQISMKREE